MKGGREVPPESDQELREFLDQTTVGLRWVSPDGRILWANRAELDLCGYAESEYVGRHIAQFLVEPQTVPDIATAIGVPAHEALFWVMAMRRYGYVREVKGNYNVVTGVAVKALADPGLGCRM